MKNAKPPAPLAAESAKPKRSAPLNRAFFGLDKAPASARSPAPPARQAELA